MIAGVRREYPIRDAGVLPAHLENTLPPDASPLRKISAAAQWGDDALLGQYVAEARAAGIRPGLLEYARDSSLGKVDIDLFLWQEALATMNADERATAVAAMKNW